MAKPKLPPAKDWQARNIEDWNSHTFFAYLQHAHRERRGIDYFAAKGIKVDLTLIKRTFDEHGKEITKRFIDKCLKEYKGSPQYMVCTFWFMHTFMKAQIMPQLQIEQQRAQDIADEEDYEELQF
ncbi:TPA: hypothetical protein ACLBZX_005143 [Bacillus cereus]|uniref:hypothetical protein n=1 Tax=Bacillus cereus group TaxID=86661 RepID=UPI000BA2987A|nr:hypothetical protein [Bacillus thuringiensis]